MKVVRVSIQQRRIVGINIFPNCIDTVKTIIADGVAQSIRIESRLKNLPESPFLVGCGKALLTHDCLSTEGVEHLTFRVDASLTPDTIIFARFFEIPVASSSLQDEAHSNRKLKEALWKACPILHLNGQCIHLPPTLKKSSCPLEFERAKLRDGENALRVHSTGERYFLVIQAGKKRSVSEVDQFFILSRWILLADHCFAGD